MRDVHNCVARIDVTAAFQELLSCDQRALNIYIGRLDPEISDEYDLDDTDHVRIRVRKV